MVMAVVSAGLVLPLFFLSNLKQSCTQNISTILGYGPNDPSSLQLLLYAQNNPVSPNETRSDGVPVYDVSHEMTAGRYGPLVIQDANFLDEMQHFDRERIPERVVHAKGAGAFGYFICTNDLSEFTQASVLTNVGKQTNVAVRFSRIGGNLGQADTQRDGRGFAIKFYTDQGNWDLVGLNLPVFWIRDALRFPSLIHATRRNPVTNLYDPVMFWDFTSLLPETLSFVLNVFSDKGIPLSYRTMNGHSTNVFVFTRPDGRANFVKFHWIPNQGVSNMPPDQAAVIAGTDPDFHTRDLYNNIAKGNFPSWNMTVEILTPEQARKMPWNPFDVTKIWPPGYTTMVPMGTLVLNANPTNFFADVEQLGFDPARLIPGIEPSVDKVLQGRLFSYTDTLMYRLGVNHESLPVNRPVVPVANQERDGRESIDGNGNGAPNYYPSSFNGPRGGNPTYRSRPYPVHGFVQSYNTTGEDNFSVPTLIWNGLSDSEKNNISSNIVQTLSQTPQFIQERALNNFYQVSPDWGNRVAALLNLSGYSPQLPSTTSTNS